jgi:hypothetical protein
MGPTGAYTRQPESSPRTWASQLSSAKYSLQPRPKIKLYNQLSDEPDLVSQTSTGAHLRRCCRAAGLLPAALRLCVLLPLLEAARLAGPAWGNAGTLYRITEGIIAHRQEIGQPFPLQEKNTDNLYLPTSARTSIADWLRSDPAKLPPKLYPKVSTALVDTAMPTLSCASCKCSPPCSTLS